ncbi:MAG TPA: hypothetical protein VLA61_19935 [Ideonella sp.]|uniref:alpha/beta hydrolase family protein n=1 Tax=Ideonella sp. TaxID=1929293 RepID=UPI002C8E68E2|nr:hypothetical protein [Ideonella sp.]HSI50544.1 hypothetical protein [Ideonella sp.]
MLAVALAVSLAVSLAGCAELNLPDLLAPPVPATQPVRAPQVAAAVPAATASAPVAVTAKPAAPPPAGPVLPPKAVIAYGSSPLQFGELRLPPGDGPFPVAVLIHGGCWTSSFATLRSTAALASELTRFGIASWNIEYRQRGDAGGGWPGTYRDWAAALDGRSCRRTARSAAPIRCRCWPRWTSTARPTWQASSGRTSRSAANRPWRH